MSPTNPVLNHHISSQFNEELQAVNTKFMTMGGLVEQQVTHAIHALLFSIVLNFTPRFSPKNLGFFLHFYL